jgi:hypothetical protein
MTPLEIGRQATPVQITCFYCVLCKKLRAVRCGEHPETADNIQIENVEGESLKPIIEQLQAENNLLHALDIKAGSNDAREAYGYLARLFVHYAPQCEPLPTLMGVVTQIDNLLVGRTAAVSQAWAQYRPQHHEECLYGKPVLSCPGCGGQLKRVTQSANSMLNSYQFDAVKAGDYYCDTCVGAEAASSTSKYWWTRELGIGACSCGFADLLRLSEGTA